jgi:hypothetical protein
MRLLGGCQFLLQLRHALLLVVVDQGDASSREI